MSKYLISLLATAPLMAFQPQATGIYADSQLTTSLGSMEAQFMNFGSYQLPGGRFSLFGVEFKQSLGWENWVCGELFGGYGISIGAMTTPNAIIAAPAKIQTYDLGVTLYTSLPCTKDQRLFVEPLLGFFALKVSAKDNLEVLGISGQNWIDLRYWGPMAGVFLRMVPLEKLEVRVGGAYLMPRLWERQNQYVNHLHGHRSGALALLSLSYKASDALAFYVKLDYQAYGTSGSASSPGIPLVPYLFRSRLAWGASFTY